MRTFQTIAALGFLLCATLTAGAHEFWVRPGSFEAKPGDLGKFFLMHGHRFEGEFVPRNEPYVERFELVAPASTQQILGRHGQPTNVARFDQPGTNVVAYQSREVRTELGPERFAAYLEEQGLDHIAAEREKLGETDQAGVEVYVRCAKALVHVSDQDASNANVLRDRAVGLPLEIVLQPLDAAHAGRTARVRVLLDGRPAVDARVVAIAQERAKANPQSGVVVRTDEDGYASIELDQSGPWMLTSLHMFRTDDRDDAHWKSYWASLTFSVSQPPKAPRDG